MTQTVGAAQLAITADASGVEAGVSRAKKTLASLGGAAKAAGTEASKGVDQIGKGADGASQKLDRATKQMIASIQRTTASLESGSRSSSRFFETLAQQRGVDVNSLKPYLQQLDAASAKQAAAAAAAKAVAPAITQVGLSAKQTTAALRQVPAQFTDIVTSLAAGQNPMQVFIQQGGQLKDVFGGIGPAARALGGYVLGLINPFTLAAGAVAALGLAYFQGAKEAQAFARAVILSGNAAGVSVGQLQEMAERIDDITGTQRQAAAALAEVVQSGQIAGESVERFTVIALRMEKETGQAVSETVKQFVELGRSPVEASTKLNEATNFLTASVARQIRILEDQGRAADAARLAQETYAGVMETRLAAVESNLGLLERAWRAVTSTAKEAWDAMLNVGRQSTLEDQIRHLQDRIERQTSELAQARGETARGGLSKGLEKLKLQLSLLTEQQRLMKRGAEAEAERARQTKAELQWAKEGEQYVSRRVRMEQEIAKAREVGARAGRTQEEIEKRVAAIRERYADKGAGRAALRIDRAELGLDIERIRGQGERLVAVYSGAERRIEALRQAGLLSDREYYEAKRGFINLETQAKEQALQQEIARLQAEKLTDADKLANDKKIADAEARLAILRADTSARLEDLSLRQQQATRAEAAEFAAAQQAAEEYFQAIQRRQDLGLSGFGKGRRQRDLDRGEFEIRERFGSARRGLEGRRAQQEILGTFTEDEKRRYQQRLQLLDQFEQRELQSWQEHNRRKVEIEGDWTRGAQEALRNYADEAENVSKQSEEFFGRTFSSMEDALAQFVQTGKISFSGLVRSILADLARLHARKAVGGLARIVASAIGSAVGGGGSPGAGFSSDADLASYVASLDRRAIGGPVSAGRMYEVNERGPELLNVGGRQFLMMGNQPGSVQQAGSGDIHIVNNTTGRVDKVEQRRTANGDRVLVLQEVAAALGDPNSPVSQALGRGYNVTRRR